jgi:pimeloyl-ACP methyl ester carboxylesterase
MVEILPDSARAGWRNVLADNAFVVHTGGRSFNPALPTVVFIHGAEHDHSVWSLQSRYLAHHGYSVLAFDLPGHMRSAGPALASVEAMADRLRLTAKRIVEMAALAEDAQRGGILDAQARTDRRSQRHDRTADERGQHRPQPGQRQHRGL